MPARPTRAAIVYDFDGTLAAGNIQETSFIPAVGMSREAFWDEVGARTKDGDADQILVYMQLMLEKARQNGVRVTKQALSEHGRNAPLFPGLADGGWFERMNAHADSAGLALDHYIVSSGILEMIAGCPIAKRFKHIFASKFIYEDDVAAWPAVAINYTTKTQYLFRINKGIENTWNHKDLNAYMPEHARPVPFSRMIFIGDGDTDVPSMKMVTYKGGHAIAVYEDAQGADGPAKVHQLIADRRVEFVAPANYEEHAPLDIIVKGILGRIGRQLDEGAL
ncbi:MAG: HAD family hydrolase [Maricaulaceae bacterium]|jgi:hypothetical protein